MRRHTSAARGRAWSASGRGSPWRRPLPLGGGIGLRGLARPRMAAVHPAEGAAPPVDRAAERRGRDRMWCARVWVSRGR
eukprot:11907452-Alexandrium_andersonii.AAC.1